MVNAAAAAGTKNNEGLRMLMVLLKMLNKGAEPNPKLFEKINQQNSYIKGKATGHGRFSTMQHYRTVNAALNTVNPEIKYTFFDRINNTEKYL